MEGYYEAGTQQLRGFSCASYWEGTRRPATSYAPAVQIPASANPNPTMTSADSRKLQGYLVHSTGFSDRYEPAGAKLAAEASS